MGEKLASILMYIFNFRSRNRRKTMKLRDSVDSYYSSTTEELLDRLEIGKSLSDLILGKVEIPYHYGSYNSTDTDWHPHPPVLIPIFLDESEWISAILKHFFLNRKETIVRYYIESGNIVEIARNEKQFITQVVLDAIMLKDGLDSTIIEFCDKVQFTQYKEVDHFAEQYGNICEDYNKLVNITTNTPLDYLRTLEQYDGDFPSSNDLFNTKQVYDACSFEIANPKYLEGIIDLPEWLKEDANQVDLFNKYIADNKLKEAWLTLNSTGWELGDVRKALNVLKTKTDDRLFHLVADRWISRFEGSRYSVDEMY